MGLNLGISVKPPEFTTTNNNNNNINNNNNNNKRKRSHRKHYRNDDSEDDDDDSDDSDWIPDEQESFVPKHKYNKALVPSLTKRQHEQECIIPTGLGKREEGEKERRGNREEGEKEGRGKREEGEEGRGKREEGEKEREGPGPHIEQGPGPHIEQGPGPHIEQGPGPHIEQGPGPHIEQGQGPHRGGIGTTLRRNPKRKHCLRNHTNNTFPKDDDYIYCEECCKEWEGECPHHPLTLILDNPVVRDGSVSKRAYYTTPYPLTIGPSKIKSAGLGVWTDADLPKYLLFGPYQGNIISKVPSGKESGYAWKLRGVGSGVYSVDALNTAVSNWMRYVNCPRTHSETNLAAFQYKANIYYKTLTNIKRGTELMVWYGDDYAQELGVSLENFRAKPSTFKQVITTTTPIITTTTSIITTTIPIITTTTPIITTTTPIITTTTPIITTTTPIIITTSTTQAGS
ncbi:hypothetical protein Pcinc_012292 [Petrolisthes cinctipes]|uniref:SET domain-containing protein n=1 Tax=Petrolisthes cinctipes TaxID=88211 RepID=A0AAE1G125_PETCI|nr:hypothetical protein Pcinc_012292 [Petrolisthes cinctipes]